MKIARQFAKYPINVRAGGRGQKKYENRRDITYREAQRYAELMDGYAQEVSMKIFDDGKQAVYNGVKTTPSLTIVGTNKSFLATNAYTLAYGRNLNDEDVAISRPVVRSTTPTPHFSSGRRAAIGIPPNVEVSRIFERHTNAKWS